MLLYLNGKGLLLGCETYLSGYILKGKRREKLKDGESVCVLVCPCVRVEWMRIDTRSENGFQPTTVSISRSPLDLSIAYAE